MKVVIIGIAGGVGRRVPEKLVREGDEPTELVRRPEQAAALAAGGIQTVPGDLVALPVDQLAEAMRGSDAIVFSAGAAGKENDLATTRIDGGRGDRALAVSHRHRPEPARSRRLLARHCLDVTTRC